MKLLVQPYRLLMGTRLFEALGKPELRGGILCRERWGKHHKKNEKKSQTHIS
jgi:hypothetical protein